MANSGGYGESIRQYRTLKYFHGILDAEVIARNWGTDHNEYLKWEHYRDRRVVNERFSLRGILGTLRQNIMSGKVPIKYYRENYGIIPPWILFGGTYFSTLINLIRLFKNDQKKELIHIMYNLDEESSSSPIVTKKLSNLRTIHVSKSVTTHGVSNIY